MEISLEQLDQVTDDSVEAFGKLLPQLSGSAKPVDAETLREIVASPAVTILVARNEGTIVGTLSLVMFRIPTGVRAWIEDVVVDAAAGGQGIGKALVREALRLAEAGGARTVDLSTRPSRVAAGNLYERVGFQQRDTRIYRYVPG
ncbi:MAG TPA: GNAT family N-acetyltransferase [Streptosporangiaceae bacterium]